MTTGNPADGGQHPKHKRGGSNKRQREKQFVVRCTKDEFNEIAANARDAGLKGGAWLRAKGLTKGDPGPRSQHIPPVENEVLIKIMGALGRLNNNVNQIAHNLNRGEFYDATDLRLILKDYAGIRDHIFQALGKEPSAGMRDWDEFVASAEAGLAAHPDAKEILLPADMLRRVIGGMAAIAARSPFDRPSSDPPTGGSGPKDGTPLSRFLPPEGHA